VTPLLIALLLPAAGAAPPEPSPPAGWAAAEAPPAVPLRITLVDLPALIDGPPTMAQSLDLTHAGQRLIARGVWRGLERRGGEGLAMGLGVPLTVGLAALSSPLNTWMHEEWHRAVLRRNAIPSTNGVYDPRSWVADAVKVHNVQDSDLIGLKRDYPADLVRLHAAGFESQDALAHRGTEAAFFHGPGPGAGGAHWGRLATAHDLSAVFQMWNELGSWMYLRRCLDPALDQQIDEIAFDEPLMGDRDAIGPDCTAWALDRDTPSAPYDARGLHPTGLGVDRYVGPGDLSPAARAELERLSRLRLIGLLNPHLFFIDGFRIGEGRDRWTAWARAVPTPWGVDVSVRGGLVIGEQRALFGLHAGVSDGPLVPAVELGWVDAPLAPRWALDLQLLAGAQPRDLLSSARGLAPFADLRARTSFRAMPLLDTWLELEGKTAGWVLGNAYLDPDLSVRAGVTGWVGQAPRE
jgi:hypothetical protein